MMKKALLMALIGFSLSVGAANYGKFKITMGGNFHDTYSAVFLLNSSGEILFVENYDYMEIEAFNFFGETTLSIRSMGDEDFIKGLMVLDNNQLIQSCSAFIDQPNEYTHSYGINGVRLSRWSKSEKKYKPVAMKASVAQSEGQCYETLIESYSDFEQF